METTGFSLGHPVLRICRILHQAISFFVGSLKTVFMCHHCARASRNLHTADRLHRVWDEFDYRVDVCRVTRGL
jgi:hypothetical protein